MPWGNDEQGGGGGGGGGPWGQGPWNQKPGQKKPSGGGGGGRGPTPPDLDELLKRAGDTLKSSLPQGGGGRGIWLVPALVVLGFIGFKSIHQIQPDENGIVLRFGAYSRTMAPGINFAVWPIETAERVRVSAENQVSIGDEGDTGLMLTGDENIVDIKFKVLWKVNDAKKFLFNMQSPQEQFIQATSESAMREIIGRTPADEALTTGRLAIQDQVREIVQKTLDGYDSGILISGVALENVDPPAPVQSAFEEVQRAKQDQVNLVNQAEQYTNQTLRAAEGDSAKLLEDAKGYKVKTINEAQGTSQRFNQIYQQYSKAKEVTRERMYIETMEDVLSKSNKVILDSSNGSQGVLPYLPLPAMQPKTEGAQQ